MLNKNPKITQALLRKYFHYNPTTGEVHRIVRTTRVGNEKKIFKLCKTYSGGYLRTSIHNKHILNHRLAWIYTYGEEPEEIDHINHIKDDNRLVNLRNVTREENNRNTSLRKNSTSGYVGVCYNKVNGTWLAQVQYKGNRVLRKTYKTKAEAITARKKCIKALGFHVNHGV